LQKLLEPEPFSDKSISNGVVLSSHVCDEIPKSDASSLVLSTDYSSMFGEEFSLSENQFDGSFLNILDIAAVEEGILHVLYAAASQPQLCRKLAKVTSDIWSVLPLVQALLPGNDWALLLFMEAYGNFNELECLLWVIHNSTPSWMRNHMSLALITLTFWAWTDMMS